MSNVVDRPRRKLSTLAARLYWVLVALLVVTVLMSAKAGAQSPRATAATPPSPASAISATVGNAPDLQGLWDFNMRIGERTSPGFFALGPLDRGWAGSITMYLTNTLAIRAFTVAGDSVRMVVASREGDVTLRARVSDDGRSMEGIVEYHGGALLPIVATRRAQPFVPR